MMDLHGLDDSKGRYVCPSDRQLALRAKLHTGWSSVKPAGPLDADEKNAIIEVIKRNEQLESAERQRVGKLVERVEKIKQRAAECGPRFCRLCGQSFGLLGPSKLICDDCRKPVCSKCSIELHSKAAAKETWLCKICSETREMWKKTGAWFYKGIPKYEVPQRCNSVRTAARETRLRTEKPVKLGIKCVDTSSEEEDDDNDEDAASPAHHEMRTKRLTSISKKHPLYVRQVTATNETIVVASQIAQSHIDWETVSISGSIATTRNGGGARRGSVSSSWSMSETSSANSSSNGGLGCGLNCKEPPPLGWLEMTVQYSEADHTLDCALLRARDLPAMDSCGLADPFCKINIITEYGTPKQKKWFCTKTVHKTINPEFNESVRFLGVEPDELASSTLYVVLLDDDHYGYDFLGAARVNLGAIFHADCCRMSIPLEAEDKHSVEAALSGPWPQGQMLISLCYNTRRRALMVQVKRCSNLMAKDNNGFSDPFVKLQLKPDTHRKKYKTSVKWRNLNPVFNEEFIFDTRPNELGKQSLTFTVWDKDLGKSNDFLGSLTLGATSKGRRLKQWKDCIRLPDYFHEQWHYLSAIQHSH